MQKFAGEIGLHGRYSISIIVPIYNVKDYLNSCLEAILSQSYQDFEVILVDDGSTDGSSEICDEYVKKDHRICVLHHTNHGVSFSRNMGLKRAQGEFIAFVDADDYLERDFLRVMVSELRLNDVDMVICNYKYVQEQKVFSVFTNRKSKMMYRKEAYQGIFIDNLVGGFVWNKIFKRQLLENIWFEEDLQICEDTCFMIKVMHKNPKMYYTSQELYNYRIRKNSTINRIDNLFDEANNLKYGLTFDRIEEQGLLEAEEIPIMHAGLCMLATSTKCDYLIANGKCKEKIMNLNHRIWGNMMTFLRMDTIPLKKRAIVFANALVNLRRLRK